jgi:hypothetical protein
MLSKLVVTALRTAVEDGEGTLDKEATSHDDLFNAYRMFLKCYATMNLRGISNYPKLIISSYPLLFITI